MYQGTNPTALRSQEWLTQALIELMEEKPFARITVKDICRKADLSRQTFYNVFSSKEEILQSFLRRKYEAEFARYREKTVLTVREIVDSFSKVLSENQAVLSSMIRNGLEWQIVEAISSCVSLFAGQFVSQERNDALLPYSEALLSGALAGLLTFRFRQKDPISMEQLTALLTDFFQGRLFEMTEQAAASADGNA